MRSRTGSKAIPSLLSEMTDEGRIGRACELAFRAHAGQVDKSGAPYIAHVVRVAAKLADPEDVVVALLHDTVEDCDTTFEEIEAAFGPETATAVDAVT